MLRLTIAAQWQANCLIEDGQGPALDYRVIL
jgi:hypothetical protein